MGREKIRSGNINTTYKAMFRNMDDELSEYIVQKINGYVFKKPEMIMENIARVTEHMRKRMESDGRNADRLVLRFLETEEGKNYVVDDDGFVWRAYPMIEDSVSFDATTDVRVLENAGAAFGQFQKDLLDFHAADLNETIIDFHNTPKRLATLFADADADPMGRAAEVKEELDYLRESCAAASRPIEMLTNGEMPIRVTHNDTKCNNVLFDKKTGDALAVIDLDTVMPGLMIYDFGDAIRFAANKAPEDEPNLNRVGLDLSRFAAFTYGFIGVLGDTIWPSELDNMALGVFAITIELASRFLDDYLTGDQYFKTDYPGHNLVRARCQIALAKDIMKKFDQMQSVIQAAAKG